MKTISFSKPYVWEQRKLSEFTYSSGIKNRKGCELPSFSITNENGFVPQDVQFENGGVMKMADKRMYYIVQPHSFAYNPARINVGSIGYYQGDINVIVSSLYEVFKTKNGLVDGFLWHWFKTSLFQKSIETLQEGGVRLYYYYDKLSLCDIAIPNPTEQNKISILFNSIDRAIVLHQRE